jgi:hypothetical protein
MVIRVDYSDNDFASAVQEACEHILYAITDEFPVGEESLDLFQEYLDRYGLENLRQRIVLAAIGSNIMFKGAHGRFLMYNEPSVESLATFDKTLHYIDENVKVAVVEAVGTEWENGEVCFIDVEQKIVVVK